MYIEIINEEFDPWQKLVDYKKAQLKGKNNIGACSVFLGTMRDINSGDEIKSMELQHYPDMTESYLEKIVRFGNDFSEAKPFLYVIIFTLSKDQFLLDISAISSVTWDSATSTLNLAQVDGTTVGDIINGWGDNEKIYKMSFLVSS